ncbi:hypothetical protein JX580_03910 [Thiomicrospira microaerophila]|uniref:hypothetical protein n=1 Tax=Thiomicrospira microaerophila TaxID=406020 RepID=UPI00200CEDC6|nr:hypothetical protein [Thiomicrospira microaerophila]UQB43036.1 hypothetical protein JX580_03910 [Thiomicrospira microaerophila]
MKLDRPLLTSFAKRMLLIPLAMFVLSSVIFYTVYSWYMETTFSLQRSIDQKERVLRQLESDVNQLSITKRDFESFLPKYESLVDRGIKQPMNRVDWADRLNDISDRLLLTGLSVNFEPERRLSANQLAQLPLNSQVIYHTRINLSGNLQIDTDLMRLVNELRSHLQADIWVERCDLRLNAIQDQAFELRPEQGNISMRCDMHVFRAQLSQFDERRLR